jgi:hypothetical protein
MGATAVERDAPTDALDIYLVGFHPMKDDPQHQFEAHHFCQQVNEDFAQCALYDGNTAEANLNGIEYIISERLFESLPLDERQYWHPHNGEILSGQLVAPGLPEIADKELMQSKMNSYGKTWHTWNTGHGNQGGDAMPLGEPALAWSFNRFGEAAAARGSGLVPAGAGLPPPRRSDRRRDRPGTLRAQGASGRLRPLVRHWRRRCARPCTARTRGRARGLICRGRPSLPVVLKLSAALDRLSGRAMPVPRSHDASRLGGRSLPLVEMPSSVYPRWTRRIDPRCRRLSNAAPPSTSTATGS